MYNLTDRHWLDLECKVGLGRIMFNSSEVSDEDRCLINSIRELYQLRDGVMYCDLTQHEIRQMLNYLCVHTCMFCVTFSSFVCVCIYFVVCHSLYIYHLFFSLLQTVPFECVR